MGLSEDVIVVYTFYLPKISRLTDDKLLSAASKCHCRIIRDSGTNKTGNFLFTVYLNVCICWL